jgi:hypothetical protein
MRRVAVTDQRVVLPLSRELAFVIKLAVSQSVHALRLQAESDPPLALGANEPLPIATGRVLLRLVELLKHEGRELPRQVE